MYINTRKLYYRLAALGMTGIIIMGTLNVPKALASSYKNQIEDAKDKKKDLEEKKKELANKLKSLETKKDNVLSYIEGLDKELSDLGAEIAALNEEIDQVNKDLDKTGEDLKEAEKTEKNQYATMKKRIQYMYENGDTSILEVLLSAENIADLLNHMEYVEEITEYDNSLLDRYKESKKKVQKMKKSLEDTLAEKEALGEELKMNQDALENVMKKKQDQLKVYESNISDAEKLSSDYTAQIAQQEALVEDLLEKERKRIEEEERKRREEEERKRKEEEERRRQEQLAANNNSNNTSGNSSNSGSAGTNNNVSAGGFRWPVPSSNRITCEFGPRKSPTAGASSYHKGIDIGASSGAPIVAAKGGTVVTASYNAAAGYYVMISHGNGVYTVYMHCQKLLVSPGQTVSQGQNIALVGSTGISTGPHLHFAVSVNGSYVNPRKYVNP